MKIQKNFYKKIKSKIIIPLKGVHINHYPIKGSTYKCNAILSYDIFEYILMFVNIYQLFFMWSVDLIN